MFVNSAVIKMFLVKAAYKKPSSTIAVLFSSSENRAS
jgi:hypothetical protein